VNAACAKTARSADASSAASLPVLQFVVGPENALVKALASSVTAQPIAHNPIVLCGASGVGKTTLAHLLAQRRQAAVELKNTILTTSADLFRALAHAADTNSVADLRSRYHRCDLLLVDDIERLVGKPAAQQFLVTTIDVLIQRGVLLLATMRRLPQETPGLLPTLASRLSGGLVVPLIPPALPTRKALVEQYAAQIGLPLTEELAACLAAPKASGHRHATAPQLRHAVLQLGASARDQHIAVKRSLVSEVLDQEAPESKAVFRQVTAAVSKQWRVGVGELRGKSRPQAIAEARSLAMLLCRRLTEASFAEIGHYFGNRDHTTVIHACRKANQMLLADPALARTVEDLATQITTSEIGV
jgi:chromosomal replication initiator protein